MRPVVTRLYDDDRISQEWGVLGDNDRVGPPAQQVLETELDGEISLYNPATEQVTILNGTASDVWLLCDGEHTVEEITELLASSYEVDEKEIRDDVISTIERLYDSGLLAG
ncbi:MAG TPA: PqqD family protein [Acidimicrobiia bacterium]|nr:PqqD family protein [Acidimicrobiia bacterium]